MLINAINWVRINPPNKGATNILAPLQFTMELLKQYQTAKSISQIFLLTDGAVDNERQICQYVQQQQGVVNQEKQAEAESKSSAFKVRLFTFGLGKFCNWYFLKMLAELGSGYSDCCIYPEELAKRIKILFEKCNKIYLNQIQISFPTHFKLKQIEYYPKPFPDLYANNTLIISGTYQTGSSASGASSGSSGFSDSNGSSNSFPGVLQVTGHHYQLGSIQFQSQVVIDASLPINTIFAKQKLDILQARHWLNEDDVQLKQQIINLSINESLPCRFTNMISYQVNEAPRHLRRDKKRDKVIRKEHDQHELKQHIQHNQTKVMLAAAASGFLIIGGALLLDGDLASTFNNLPIGSDDFGGDLDMDCCDDCCDNIEDLCADIF